MPDTEGGDALVDAGRPIELTVVVPVHGEGEPLRRTLGEWSAVLRRMRIAHVLRVYDDGSGPQTADLLDDLALDIDDLSVVHQDNVGHGPTLVRAYREAVGEWILQIDGDDGVGPAPFPSLWERRHDHDLLTGIRRGREAPLVRRLVTWCAERTVAAAFRPPRGEALAGSRGAAVPDAVEPVSAAAVVGVPHGARHTAPVEDVNSPYRLMRRAAFQPLFEQLPSGTFAPNLALTGLAVRCGLRVFEAPVQCRPPASRPSSLTAPRLARAVVVSLFQTLSLALRVRRR